jgi:hypothetical protein
MAARAGIEPADSRGKGSQKAQWDAQKAGELLRLVEAWSALRPEIRAAILVIVASAEGGSNG